MIIILLKFKKEYISFLKCEVSSSKITIHDNEKRHLKSADSEAERYKKVFDEIQQLKSKYSPNLFAFQRPQKNIRGILKDLDGYAYSAIFYLYCFQNEISVINLEKRRIKARLKSNSSKDFKYLYEDEKKYILENFDIRKSNDNFEGLVLLSLIKTEF